jgi:hypothetical protein
MTESVRLNMEWNKTFYSDLVSSPRRYYDHTDSLGHTQPSMQWVPGVKWPEREVHHLTPSGQG